MQLSLTVCNVCQDPTRPTKKYEIRESGRKSTPDLCDEHAGPLEALMPAVTAPARKAAVVKAATAPARRGRRAPRVMSLDEIEKGKQQGTL